MGDRTKSALAVVGLCVLAVLVVELLARGAIFAEAHLFSAGVTEKKADLPAYKGADYDPKVLYRELAESDRIVYKPYVVWGRKPFNGTLININESGNRVTLNNSSQAETLQVWTMGGSSMWGYGAPDNQTIPSHLAGLLNLKWGVDTQVTNLGEIAYVSTQDVFALIRELQSGKRPDVVIFYNGYNDAVSANQGVNAPGGHFHEPIIRAKYERVLGPLVRSTGTFRLVDYLMRRTGVGRSRGTAPEGVPKVADQAADIWLENSGIVAALGASYGFAPVVMFQPALALDAKPLDESERRILDREVSKSESEVLRHMRSRIREQIADQDAYRHVYDLSDSFGGAATPIYLDAVHITGSANLLVAERMSAILRDELCRQTPANVSPPIKMQLASACAKPK